MPHDVASLSVYWSWTFSAFGEPADTYLPDCIAESIFPHLFYTTLANRVNYVNL